MPRVKKPAKVKEPIRLRMKDLANGNKSLYLDIYRDGKRAYEYLKMYLIPETDNNARVRNQTTMAAANAIKSKRIIQLTNGEAGIETREKVKCTPNIGRISICLDGMSSVLYRAHVV